MASIRMLEIYKSIEEGKRVVVVTARELPALRIWLWRKGYSMKTNCMDEICNVQVEKKL